MSAELIPFNSAGLPAALADMLGGADVNDDLSAGVSGGFSVISIRGSKWRVKHGGDETLLVDAQGEMQPSIRVVMLKSNKDISKNYYEGGFVEGSTDAPDCFSVDGIKPDASVENPQNNVCATCPFNQFGSRITENGSKSKACSDSRRVAVVPEGDYKNEQFNGPMLLRVPAASLSELAGFGKAMKAKGYPYNTIVTRLSFDPETAYPKIKFNAVRPVTDEEATEIMGLLGDSDYRQKLDFILAQAVEVELPAAAEVAAVEKKPDPTEFEDEAVVAPEPVAKPKAKAKAKAKAKPKEEVQEVMDLAESEAKPAAEEELPENMDKDEIDEILAKLQEME